MRLVSRPATPRAVRWPASARTHPEPRRAGSERHAVSAVELTAGWPPHLRIADAAGHGALSTSAASTGVDAPKAKSDEVGTSDL
jgi:hypothetical protein